MQVSGASLDLYCDSKRRVHPWHAFPDQYTDIANVAACRKQAKKAGWKLTPDGDLCPRCNPKSPRYVKEEDQRLYTGGWR